MSSALLYYLFYHYSNHFIPVMGSLEALSRGSIFTLLVLVLRSLGLEGYYLGLGLDLDHHCLGLALTVLVLCLEFKTPDD